MAATRDTIGDWFDAGVAFNATHMLVVCDTFDHDDYPVYVRHDGNADDDTVTEDGLVYIVGNVRRYAHARDGRDMQRLVEVYDLRSDRDAQLAEYRAYHPD